MAKWVTGINFGDFIVYLKQLYMPVCIEMEGYSVVYFDHIATIEAPYCCTEQSSYGFHRLIRYSHMYEACMSPTLNRNTAIWRFKHGNAIEEITFDFYTRLSHNYSPQGLMNLTWQKCAINYLRSECQCQDLPSSEMWLQNSGTTNTQNPRHPSPWPGGCTTFTV